ncbi:hypothetical protein EYZ11_013114 [Aspergillus tanneri]|uniref:Uncharacterized protein n=1 Tax=Aspergillus tanneri TaxID=1220188 RepID=A0A4S3J0N2_9EURO|nr:hypothetical protein EYZ11_013114 [Aspergillus tanneri]
MHSDSAIRRGLGAILFNRSTAASEEDRTAPLANLNRYFYHEVKPPNRELLPGQLYAYKLIYEEYRNVIIEEPELDGVGADVILKKPPMSSIYLGIQRARTRGADRL